MKMLLILILAYFFKASTSHVTGSGSSIAQFGGDAYYRCKFAAQTGVLQVTWQRLFKDESLDNLATYSKRFGPEVNMPYTGKVIFTEASLNSTAITLRNVTWEDESCYVCSFNVYPDGSKRKQICLTVEGISKVNTNHTLIDSPLEEEGKHAFSCSATGKPAPTITWDFSGATDFNQTQTSIVRNADNTFTSSSILQRGPAAWIGHVDCVVNSGRNSERREKLYFSEEQGEKEKGEEQHRYLVPLAIAAVIAILCIVAAAIVMQKRLKRKAASRDIP
ncbi:OX-2 membrane glycoprotein-like isoform X2 [Melanotaenia boesemani]|uniref:OX-2 membrane glycoprotein-like isoform X2 n=1 Tax=Melanotaenia boesemani TaxID=1250792 RepID=UPI001C03DB05|nr:OX-2 membrane glycoprotein-like isoform X2 [Melanotaenia boesemani]